MRIFMLVSLPPLLFLAFMRYRELVRDGYRRSAYLTEKRAEGQKAKRRTAIEEAQRRLAS